jgi:hypothetical protein
MLDSTYNCLPAASLPHTYRAERQNQRDDEHRPCRRTPHAPDAAGAARKLGLFYHSFFVLLPLLLPTAASGRR